MSPSDEIAQVKEASKENLLAMKNVVGVGVGYKVQGGEQSDEFAIVVMVSRKLPLTRFGTRNCSAETCRRSED